jgi:hypothetical protein
MDAALGQIPFEINIALHHIEFVIDLRPPPGGSTTVRP